MNKNLLTGLASLVVAGLLKIVLPQFGIDVDLGPLEDGTITLGDVLFLAGVVLTSISQPVKNEVRKTTVGRMVLGEPKIG